jgi:glycosyltransferase involved in cell wall biosynthesis
MQIHQILPTLSQGDAIGNEVRLMQSLFREWGYTSHIFAENIHPETTAFYVKEYEKYSHEDNILVYHYSIGSSITEFFKTLPDKKILIYHNITPPEYFIGINEGLFKLLKDGRDSLPSLIPFVELAIGDSEYNRQELEKMGFSPTTVLPILIDFDTYHRFNITLVQKYTDDYVNILFVGRISPNKKQENILKIFYYYKSINSKSRLFLVGGYNGCERYLDQLRDIVKKLQLSDVVFTGSVPFEDLISYYKIADVFLCMSEHEGFCIPLVESMFFNIPIIAYNSTAVPQTLKNSGILVNEKQYDEIAELINLITEDNNLKRKIIEQQKIRHYEFMFENNKKKFRQIIYNLIDGARSRKWMI